MAFAGQKMQECRKVAGLSQRQLGELLGISRIRISEYETGLKRPRLDRLQRIARILGVQVDDFLDGEIDG